MKRSFQPWQLAAIVALLCGGAMWAMHWWRASQRLEGAGLVTCLPPDQTTHLYIDVDALRRSGILALLAGSTAVEEPDYRGFVTQTGFDYRTDLDAVAAGFFRGNVYFVLRGRFDWKRLSKYALNQGGKCVNATCEMPGSAPDRHISYYLLASDVLALAVSTEERGVVMIGRNQWHTPLQLPPEPVWISAPPFAFSDPKGLPAGTQSFLRPLSQAQKVVFAIGPDGDRLKIRLEVVCANAAAAAELANNLTATTDYLNKALEREHHTPSTSDFSGVLTAGKFQQADTRVTGTWPVERSLVEALANGKIQ